MRHSTLKKLKILIAVVILVLTTILINKFEFTEKAPPPKYLTFDFGALKNEGLGNVLFEVMALIGIAKKHNRIPFYDSSKRFIIEKRLNHSFPNVLAKLVRFNRNLSDEIEHIPFQSVCCACMKQNFTGYGKYLKLGGLYFQSFKYFDEFRNEVRDLLIPPKRYVEIAQSYMKSGDLDDFNICAHIRRGDFVTDKFHSATNSSFIVGALEYLIEEYKYDHDNISIILIGNDEDFAKNEVASEIKIKTRILPKSDPEIDIAFSRKYCDVVLISAPSSTFGWWLGYLSKTGNFVYYQDIKETEDQVVKSMIQQDFYPNYWVKLKTHEKTGKVQRF